MPPLTQMVAVSGARRSWQVSGAIVGLCGGVLVASFATTDFARNDVERFDDLRRLFVFLALFAG